MTKIVRFERRTQQYTAIDERASRLGEVTLELLKPMEELGAHMQALDRELTRVQMTIDALADRPNARALKQAIHPMRDQLVLAASQLASEIERVGRLCWTRH